ncbi:prominin [Xylocopa sonorina]|uniref:prominin n=1 Tax=Xylocopa sonorina TaxID=1818115 RepID=UPI00403B2FAB
MVLSGILTILYFVSNVLGQYEDIPEVNSISNNCNCSSTDSFNTFDATTETHHVGTEIVAEVLIDETRNDTNTSRWKTSNVRTDWDDWNPKLKFPSIDAERQYRMANLHLERGIFFFDFLRKFLSLIQPYDVPIDLLVDAMENRIDISKLISESIHLEAVLLAVFGICCILCCVVPGTELWLACRPMKKDYQPSQHPSALAFFLTISVCILGVGMIIMIMCNETVSTSVEKLPVVAEVALQDLNDYHSSTTIQVRKCLSRSLDVASEAILADLDNIEELLGKPIQSELSSETGLDIALDALVDVLNVTQTVSSNVESLLKEGESIRNMGKQLSREIESLRKNLELTLRACTGQDRPLCTVVDSSGLQLTLKMDQFVRDDHLIRLRNFKRENLSETIRETRGEYLYMPQHITRSSLQMRNEIRREVNKMRARIFDEARNIEETNTELAKQLESARRLKDHGTPYIVFLEQIRWFIGIGTVLCVLLIWLLLVGALCCRCNTCETKVRSTLLCGVFLTCFISIILWIVFITMLVLSSHTEMLICRPLHDPNYNTIEAILETRVFLGKKLSVSLKDMFEKCQRNEPGYPAFGLGNTMKLEQLAAYWTWSSFPRMILRFKVELKTLKIFTPSLKMQLYNLLYACGLNLTEHRLMIQGRILSKDLEALSDQIDKVSQQMSDRVTARSLEAMVANMEDLNLKRIRPLMRLQDTLLYKLAALELQVHPLQRQVDQSLSHLKTIQYYIDNQGNNIAQMKTKLYVDRLTNYLDQWRSYVLTEMGTGLTKCRALWDVVEGIKLLVCNHFLGNLSGYWLGTFCCAIVMIAATPIAHVLSLVYKKSSTIGKNTSLIPTRSEDPPTETNEGETWQTPDPPPLPQEGWQ